MSIVVPCIQVDSLAARCLAECHRLFPEADLVVVVDAPSAEDRLPPSVRLLVSGPATIAAKRNLAARESSAEYLAFVDSDAYPARGWLENAVRVLERDPTIGAVGGPNVSPHSQSHSERVVGLALRSPLVSGGKAYLKSINPARFTDDLPACNMIVRRCDFLAVGGMNECLFTAEDIAFCDALRNAGLRVYYTPDVLVYHKNRNFCAFVNQRLTYGACLSILVHLFKNRRYHTIAIRLLPAAFCLFTLSIPMVLVWPLWAPMYAGMLGLYLTLTFGEACRRSQSVGDLPGTFAAIVVGNLGVGVGTIGQVLGIMPDLRRLYRNDK